MKVKLFRIHNYLRRKAGVSDADAAPGFIDDHRVEEADQLIVDMCDQCSVSIGVLVEALNGHWDRFRIEKKRGASAVVVKRSAQDVFTTAHEIKDISAMCGYHLISHFAESLRDYVVDVDWSLPEHHVIAAAHIDAIVMAHKRDIKEDCGEKAQQLKDAVKKAIEKYG